MGPYSEMAYNGYRRILDLGSIRRARGFDLGQMSPTSHYVPYFEGLVTSQGTCASQCGI